jgi:hypothetical protein
LRETALQFVIDISCQVSKARGWEGGKLVARGVAFLVEVLARREGGRDIGSGGLSGRRRGLLAAYQLIVDICTEFMELRRRQAQEFIASLI